MRGARQNAEYVNSIQKWAEKNTPGNPILFHEELPARTRSPKGHIVSAGDWPGHHLGSKDCRGCLLRHAKEVRARGSAAVPDSRVGPGPRSPVGTHGRNYGEDPYLGSRIGVAAVKGFQGEGPLIDKSHVIATASILRCMASRRGAPMWDRELLGADYPAYFLKPFEAAGPGGRHPERYGILQ